MNDLFRQNVDEQGGLTCLTIFGLHCLDFVELEQDLTDDPRFLLFREVAYATSCALHIGVIDINYDVIDQTWLRSMDTVATECQLTIYSGEYSYHDPADDGPDKIQSWYFETAPAELWRPPLSSGTREGLDAVFWAGAIALYGYRADQGTLSLDQSPKHTNWPCKKRITTEWLTSLLERFEFCLISGHDGRYVEVYAKSETHLATVRTCLERTTELFKQTNWYRQHKDELVWVDDDESIRIRAR